MTGPEAVRAASGGKRCKGLVVAPAAQIALTNDDDNCKRLISILLVGMKA